MQEAPFFRGWGGSWDTPYGRFFLGWYSRALLDHGERLVALATSVFTAAAPARCTLSNHAAPERSIAGAGPAYGIPGLLPAGGGEPDPAASAGPSSPTGSDRSSGGGAPERARGGPAEAAAGGGAGEGGAGGARGGEGPAGFAAAVPGSRAVSRSPSGLSAMSTSTSASTLDAGSEVRVFITCAHVFALPRSCLGTDQLPPWPCHAEDCLSMSGSTPPRQWRSAHPALMLPPALPSQQRPAQHQDLTRTHGSAAWAACCRVRP